VSAPAELDPPEDDEGSIVRRAGFRLPLDAIAPGTYVAHAIVRARGEIVAERTRQVEVLPGHAPAAAPTAAARNTAVSPIAVLGGDLAHRYLATLEKRLAGTPAAPAARRAVAGNWEQAELDLRHIDDDAAGAVQALRGFASFAREEYASASASLRASFDADPQNALTAFFLGWAYEGAAQPREALGAWRNAAYLDPSLVSAHLALAEGYLKLSEPALAAQALRAGLAAVPSSPELHARLEQIERMKP
jgi:cytochrome c-type biogenesis protein CcmH/NrfG